MTFHFPVTIGLHQGSTLSPYLFTLIIVEFTGHIQEEVNECLWEHLGVASIDSKIRETCLRWFEHAQRMPEAMLVKKSFSM